MASVRPSPDTRDSLWSVLEYSTGDGDHPANIPGRDAAAARPDDWVAPRSAPLYTGATAPEPVSLAYTVTVADLVASVLDHQPTRARLEAQLWKAGWRRSLPMMALTLGLVLFTNLFMFDLGLGWSLLSTVLLGGLFAVVQWSQIDHGIKRRMPALLGKQALHDLAQRGEQRRVVAEPAGLTLVDAAGAGHFGWPQVQLTETDGYVIVTASPIRWAIPRTVGQPLASLVQVARGYGAR